jgi:L-fuculose-phosphate aldolase
MITDANARTDVLETAVEMSRLGLAPGRSGNVSRRWLDGLLITPSGVAYDALTADAIVCVDGRGQALPGQGIPSSELALHLAVYRRRPDIVAIVHTHSMHATVLACAHRGIPAFHYMVAAAGGDDVPCVPYATFGSAALAALVADGIQDRNACLLAQHGALAVGPNCASALELAATLEMLAEQYYKLLCLGEVHLLDQTEMARVLQKFRTYGSKVDGITRD